LPFLPRLVAQVERPVVDLAGASKGSCQRGLLLRSGIETVVEPSNHQIQVCDRNPMCNRFKGSYIVLKQQAVGSFGLGQRSSTSALQKSRKRPLNQSAAPGKLDILFWGSATGRPFVSNKILPGSEARGEASVNGLVERPGWAKSPKAPTYIAPSKHKGCEW
jgi:hypothetical protein